MVLCASARPGAQGGRIAAVASCQGPQAPGRRLLNVHSLGVRAPAGAAPRSPRAACPCVPGALASRSRRSVPERAPASKDCTTGVGTPHWSALLSSWRQSRLFPHSARRSSGASAHLRTAGGGVVSILAPAALLLLCAAHWCGARDSTVGCAEPPSNRTSACWARSAGARDQLLVLVMLLSSASGSTPSFWLRASGGGAMTCGQAQPDPTPRGGRQAELCCGGGALLLLGGHVHLTSPSTSTMFSSAPSRGGAMRQSDRSAWCSRRPPTRSWRRASPLRWWSSSSAGRSSSGEKPSRQEEAFASFSRPISAISAMQGVTSTEDGDGVARRRQIVSRPTQPQCCVMRMVAHAQRRWQHAS